MRPTGQRRHVQCVRLFLTRKGPPFTQSSIQNTDFRQRLPCVALRGLALELMHASYGCLCVFPHCVLSVVCQETLNQRPFLDPRGISKPSRRSGVRSVQKLLLNRAQDWSLWGQISCCVVKKGDLSSPLLHGKPTFNQCASGDHAKCI